MGIRIKKKSSLQSLTSSTTDSASGNRRKKVSIYDEYQKDFKTLRNQKNTRRNLRDPNVEPRITINVRGKRFETYIDTLDRFPNTLLGNKRSRDKYYNPLFGEIILSRDLQIFEAVLFYYQSEGILSRPTWVSETVFNKELIFYELIPKPIKVHKKVKPRRNRPIFQQIIWNLMEHPSSSKPAHVCAIISILTIVVSIMVFCLETVPALVKLEDKVQESYNRHILFCFETSVMVWFTVEYILRVISTPKRTKFILSFMGVVDIVVILPYYINTAMHENGKGINLSVFRILRMFRVFRIFKLTRYSTGLKVLGKTIISSLGQLIALLLCLFLSAIIFSSLLYYIEHENIVTEIDNSDTFISIPDTFWYVIITMTSVGYGDVVPKTIIGRIVAAFCMVTGIIVLLCLPTPVFITHFGHFYDSVVRKAFNENENLTESEIWKNDEEQLLIPRWMNDPIWRERIRNDCKEQLMIPGINVYLSNPNIAVLSRTCSQEVLYNRYKRSPTKSSTSFI